MDENEYNVLANNDSDKCVPLKKSFVIGLSAFPALVAFENFFFLLAIFLYRHKLKHKYVYRCVASTLSANLIISLLGFYHFLNYYFGFEPHGPNLWWALRKGMQLALSLVLCGNIGLLIYEIRNNTYIVDKKMYSIPEMNEMNPGYRKKKANALIFVVWAFPVVYGLLSMSPWNCTASQCTCTLSYESGSPICNGSSCSHLYTPMSKSYLFLVVIFWALECLGLLGIFLKSIFHLRRAQDQKSNAKNFNVLYIWQALMKSVAMFKVLYILFFFFIVCTAPVMFLFALDFTKPEIKFSQTMVNFLLPLPLIYCAVCPFILWHKLSGVKTAVTMIFKCPSRKSRSKKRDAPKRKHPRPTSVIVTSIEKGSSTSV